MKRVAIIGVTGAVGQEFVLALNKHPWFEVKQIAASERSAKKKFEAGAKLSFEELKLVYGEDKSSEG